MSILKIYRDKQLQSCYAEFAVDSFQQEGGEYVMNIISSLIISVGASIVAYYICKWLDRDK